MRRLTSRDENGMAIGKKPLKQMNLEDVQELLDRLCAHEDLLAYWERPNKKVADKQKG